MSLADVTRVIHNLLEEGVPIRDMKTIAETLSLQRGVDKSP
jgi:flagellar biosynthesis protein FlhA